VREARVRAGLGKHVTLDVVAMGLTEFGDAGATELAWSVDTQDATGIATLRQALGGAGGDGCARAPTPSRAQTMNTEEGTNPDVFQNRTPEVFSE